MWLGGFDWLGMGLVQPKVISDQLPNDLNPIPLVHVYPMQGVHQSPLSARRLPGEDAYVLREDRNLMALSCGLTGSS